SLCCVGVSHIIPEKYKKIKEHENFMALGRNQPLKRERPKWKSDYPMTEGQLRSKRDEFWDTAPAFEGRKEIWDALRAAASAFESNDHLLAQAILDGASITLPHGKTLSTVCKHGHVLLGVSWFSKRKVWLFDGLPPAGFLHAVLAGGLPSLPL
uniref:Ubiquitin domain containing 2 n=1 Tax=Poecilia latipinna TaxID=48699 RepID=A0A3B3VD16_9TELE